MFLDVTPEACVSYFLEPSDERSSDGGWTVPVVIPEYKVDAYVAELKSRGLKVSIRMRYLVNDGSGRYLYSIPQER